MALQTYTAQQIITAAHRMLGILGEGETLSAGAAADSLQLLNELLDAWGTQRLTKAFQQRTVVPLVAGQASYTIGEGGDIDLDGSTALVYVNLLLPTPTP